MNTAHTRILQYFAAVVAMIVLALPVPAANAEISAALQPSNIAVGESAQLTVTITGDADAEPSIPQVPGLQFISAGQSSQYQSINGAVTASSSRMYMVTAIRVGNFTIPQITLGSGSDTQSTKPLVLHVTASDSVSSSPQSAAALPPPGVSASDEDDQAVSSNGKQAFLRLVIPKRKLYIGELVPVQIKAYFVSGLQASVDGLPSLSSDAFTLNSLDNKPVQTEEDIDGHSYAVLTWTTGLSAVKTGDYALKLELPVEVTVRDNARRARDPDDPFDDSFFDDFFSGGSVQKNITLTSEPESKVVQPLPLANRPADFSGGVGQFRVTAEASPDHVTAGDPTTLRLTVTGSGNFDRVSSNLVNNSTTWKSYKPVARFAASDSVGLRGTKTFEQAVVPLQAGKLNIPPVNFSYFDPEDARYITRSTGPIAIQVAPASSVAAMSSSPPVAPAASPAQLSFSPNRVEPGAVVTTLKPLFLQSWFLIVNVSAWACLAVVFFAVQRHTQRARDPRLARARQADRAIHDQLAAMDLAMQHAETVPFFTAARRALQQRLGERWNLPPETITLSEINARFNGHADGIRPVFQMADQVAYSHESLPPGDLAAWKRVLTEQLTQLETL
jgi:hypothetical protein